MSTCALEPSRSFRRQRPKVRSVPHGLIDSRARERIENRRRPTRRGFTTRMARRRSNGQKKTRRGSGVIGRALGMMAFLPIASRAPLYARLVLALVMDDRMPNSRKALLAGAAGYLLIGRDLLPDEVPILGGLDDLVIVVLAVDLFLDGVPAELLNEKLVELDIDRAAFDQDMARIRRLTPGPVRKTIRRVPQLIGQAGAAIEHSGIGPRVRGWISKEGSIA
jgi:uncharacterized membrane protein YkvA (DUF1232 family)